MTERHDSIILHFVVRVFMVPFIFVFGVYVFLHGELSPGGGFQAGAIVAASIILGRLVLGSDVAGHRFPTRLLTWGACVGVAIYVLAGVVPMFFGLNYLDYDKLPLGWFNEFAQHQRTDRAHGIFLVELGVFVAVISVMVLLYDYLTMTFQNSKGNDV